MENSQKSVVCSPMALENDLGRDNIRQLVWRIAIPSMLAQFVSV